MDTLNNQIKRIATGISRENTRTSSTTDANDQGDTCPICGGMGFVTKNVPVEHPDFGKAFPCVCQQETIAAHRSARLYKMSNLDAVADKTFDTFLTTIEGLTEEQLSNLRSSFDLARSYAQEPVGWLLFRGNYGSGKTHLAAAIANYRFRLGGQALFITAPDLLDHLRSTYGPNTEIDYDALFEQVRSAPLLVLDDLGAESSTPWAQEKLYQLLNHRYLHRLHTVITTNCALDDLDPRIHSRLVDWTLTRMVNMDLPDFRRQDSPQQEATLSSLRMYMSMTFETFDIRQHALPFEERQNLRRAYEMSINYAEHPEGWLLFVGAHGSGKTHLAASIASYHKDQGGEVMFVTMPDLLDHLRAAFSPNSGVSFDKRFHELRTVGLLVIDQLDMSSATLWAREKMRQLADYRYLNQLPTVFTTAQTFAELDPMLRSRLLDGRLCRVFAIIAPDYRGGTVAKPDSHAY